MVTELLDLDARHSDKAAPLPITADGHAAAAALNPTALLLDRWSLSKGRELLNDIESGFSDVLDDGPREAANEAAADFFASAFLPEPELAPASSAELRRRMLDQTFQTPEYQELHAATRLDAAASEIAALSFAQSYVALVKSEAEAEEQACKSGKPRPEAARDMAALRAGGRAVKRAAKDVEEYHEAAGGLSDGGGPGALDPKRSAALFRRVRSDAGLRRICALAGRFRRVAAARQRQKTNHGTDDVVGVTLGDDLARLLPVELAQLADDDLELPTLRRLVERQTMVRDLRAVEPVGKGPIVVCVDESGSMSGDKVYSAKALGLALAWVARRQNRWCCLIAYSGDTGHRILTLKPGTWNEPELLDWLSEFLSGGSCRDVPLRELPDWWADPIVAPAGKTDVVLITDAIAHFTDDEIATWNAWRRESRARCTALVIRDDPGPLRAACDEVYRVPAITPDDPDVQDLLAL